MGSYSHTMGVTPDHIKGMGPLEGTAPCIAASLGIRYSTFKFFALTSSEKVMKNVKPVS